MSILKSALKNNAPANRAIVQRTTVDKTFEIVELGVAESAPWHKEFPLSGGDYNNVVDDPITKEYQDKSLRAYAVARFAAIQPACGKGLLSDEDDTDEWEGSQVHKNENRNKLKNPIIWLPRSALLVEAADHFAPYGRRAGKAQKGLRRSALLEELLFITRRLPLGKCG